MSENTTRRDVLKGLGSAGAIIGSSQGIVGAKKQRKMKEKISEVEVESLDGHEAKRVTQKIRKKDSYKILKEFVINKGLSPNLRSADVSVVTEANGAERNVVLIPLKSVNKRSKADSKQGGGSGYPQSGPSSDSFIVYNGLDDLSEKEIESLDLNVSGDVSAQNNSQKSLKPFSVLIFEQVKSNTASAQNEKNNRVRVTSASIENGQVKTNSKEAASMDSFLGGVKRNEVTAQGGCNTCYRNNYSCTNYNFWCVSKIAGIYLAAIGSCGLCYTSGGTAEIIFACSICLGSVIGAISNSASDEVGCDPGNDCGYEWVCVSDDKESDLCNCPDNYQNSDDLECSDTYRPA